MQKTVLFLFTYIIVGSSSHLTCTSELQKDIFSTLQNCSPIPTVINLRDGFKNKNVLQVIPSHVTVDRCSGSCNIFSHTCQAINLTYQVVQVMMVMTQWPHGEHQLVCDQIMVDVHQDCSCGCETIPEDCHPELQYYHHPSCR